jgi:preprotein translocase subunit SecE
MLDLIEVESLEPGPATRTLDIGVEEFSRVADDHEAILDMIATDAPRCEIERSLRRHTSESTLCSLLFESAMAKISPFKFLQEVRAETEKVTWPTRRETFITTIMVFVMVAIASVLFLLADQVIRIFITFILGVAA